MADTTSAEPRPASTPAEDGADGPSDVVVPAPSASTELVPTHPLHRTWSLWYDRPDRKTSQQDWAKNLKRVYDFNTVEDAWALFNNVAPASGLRVSSNYHLFVKGVEPSWEHDANRNGGKWVITLNKPRDKKQIDNVWMYTVLAIIGESFDQAEEICGAVCSARKKHDRVAVWTADASNEAHCKRIGHQLKEFCELPQDLSIGYQVHADCIKRNRSFTNRDRYTV
ncbi:eukaryotic translation initiation factor 4E-1 [Thecamonas trahens ATCC 50062]|uniref:Eukaryotic translation initiation factor 4E-1 n=1 Tax=Thecamonas trahens ATCC 50062 TaxID=461836 RepID=A0A0L0DE29_THETB|nr:eukaryotic translation initiation factor 4E-1 [Thecamonas trahens ATCC 50062]KNC50562.1 eukaryotic translation initiation factor 4E-1 [Thecamonas trahens ATCC 50062]|eukprot:XP_013762452.1 eukaryotic translation initiation factor 4E-1 [Thecamonas trahens ATCC 50062]